MNNVGRHGEHVQCIYRWTWVGQIDKAGRRKTERGWGREGKGKERGQTVRGLAWGCKLIPIDVTDVTLQPIKRSDEIFA